MAPFAQAEPEAPDNPGDLPQSLFEGFTQSAQADPQAWIKGFLDNFYNYDTLVGTLVSEQAFQASFNLAGHPLGLACTSFGSGRGGRHAP